MREETQKPYGIGAVARRTGLSAPNIRMWEKRYRAVDPERTASNRRLYSAEDVERLTLLHALTERGHTISNIANLSLAALQERVAEEDAAPAMPPGRNGRTRPSRLLAVGMGLVETLSAKGILEAEFVAQFDELAAASKAPDIPAADLVVIEAETLFPETISTVRDLVNRSKAPRCILVYRFAASKTATALARAIPGVQLFPAPLSDDHLRRECLAQLHLLAPQEAGTSLDPAPIPERLYTAEQLITLAGISTTVECECPQHLAGLLQSLSAFEKYSRECEDRNPEDALLHAFLHRTTAHVRRSMEEALQHVVRTEGIALD